MINEYYFQVGVSLEQIRYTNQLVNYSIISHPVPDVFSNDPEGQKRQREFRFTGTLGEILFADVYGLPRPTKAYGAIDGQDFGKDFELEINGKRRIIDVKSMHRKHNKLKKSFVLNIPCYQLQKSLHLTDTYFCISLHKVDKKVLIASFLGFISTEDIIEGKIGILYQSGTKRIKDDLSSFIFQRDTFEIEFGDFSSPPIPEPIRKYGGFEIKTLIQ